VSDSWIATVSIPEVPADPNPNGEPQPVKMLIDKTNIPANKQEKKVRFIRSLP
jgi:hypothetical protein